jgi:hypothetical protein
MLQCVAIFREHNDRFLHTLEESGEDTHLATDWYGAGRQLDLSQKRQLPVSVGKSGGSQDGRWLKVAVIVFIVQERQPELRIDRRIFITGEQLNPPLDGDPQRRWTRKRPFREHGHGQHATTVWCVSFESFFLANDLRVRAQEPMQSQLISSEIYRKRSHTSVDRQTDVGTRTPEHDG